MKRPNVLLISIDTLRADHLSCYGYHKDTTPNLDRLGREGIVYENTYSTAAWTPPAHASMLTGLYPSSHGAFGDHGLNHGVTTLAEAMLGGGYKTSGFINNSQVGELVGLERGHQTFQEIWKGHGAKSFMGRGMNYLKRKTIELIGLQDHGAHRTNQLAIQQLLENKPNPFYMFLHYIEPHNPLDPPRSFKNRFKSKRSHGKIDKEKLDMVADNPLIYFVKGIQLNNDEVDVLKGLYDAEIAYLDQKIGNLIDFLKREGLYDNTMIIITADHGEHFGEHGLYSHVASLYEPIVHIPMIIKYPGQRENGGRISNLVQLVDIFPTVMEVTGRDQENTSDLQGKSLVGMNGSKNIHDFIISEWEGRVPSFILNHVENPDSDPIVKQFKSPMTMIRQNQHKFIKNENGAEELYDLEKDPGEENNIVDKLNAVANDLRRKLGLWQNSNRKIYQGTEMTMDELTKKNLESLGYM